MKIVVQKFGGTSLETAEKRNRCILHVKRELEERKSVVVVVSAMGRKGSPYATDTLLSLLENNSDQREKDILLSTGELISSAVFSSALRRSGIDSIVLTGWQAGIITDNHYGSSLIVDIKPQRILEELKKGKVVVIPGFQGITEDYEMTTLGRGGSDTTAAAIAAAIRAEVVDIFTDVEGIMTADPRMVKNAKRLETISYDELSQLASGGAKVVHPRAVALVKKHHIPMRVRSTFSDLEGTKVASYTSITHKYDGVEILISGIASHHAIHRFSIKKKNGAFTELFDYLSHSGISIDFINVSGDDAVFTVSESDSEKLEIFLIRNQYPFLKETDVSKVSIVGNAINGMPGIMTKIVKALENEKIALLQTCDSNNTIWLLVKRKDEEKAVCALHRAFFAEQKDGMDEKENGKKTEQKKAKTVFRII